jgi:two-component system, sensor histidine kinase RetS
VLKLLKTCLFIVLSLTAHAVFADSHIILDGHPDEPLPLQDHLMQWMGDDQPLDKLNAQLYLFSYWKPLKDNDGFSLFDNKPLQLMFSIENRSNVTQELLLLFPNALIDRIKVQYWIDGTKSMEYETGNSLPFNSRPIAHRDFAFPLNLDPARQVTVFLEITGQQDTFFQQSAVWQRQAYFEKTDVELLALAMLWGLLLLLIIYHSFLYYVVKEASYLFFTLFIAAFLVRTLTMNNIAFEFLWPNIPSLQGFMIVSSVMASTLLTALFAMSYLSISRQTPNLLLSYKIYIAAHVIAIVIQAILGWPIQSALFWLLLAAPFTLMILVSSFWLYRQGNSHAGIFLIGIIIVIISGSLTTSTQYFDFDLPFTPKEEIGQLLQIIFLSFALSMQVDKLREKNHIAYAKNKAKSDFLAKMSHEIRTPINGVLGMAQLLSETPLSRKQQHYADVINHCSKTLLNVINNILEYSKIEAGKIELESTPFNIDELLLNNNGLFWPQIHNKGLAYQFYFDPAIPHNLLGDPTRLQQIFNNVFSNAIKFTDHGSIRLEVKARSISADEVDIQFFIRDTGIGIKEEDIEHLFIPFSQANVSTTRLYGGSGLGLNITQQLVHLMGGDIELKSEHKVGSRFIFNIPFAIDTATEAKHKPDFTLFAKKRALILSKEDPQEDLIKNVIRHLRMEYHLVSDPEYAFNLIVSGADMPFDIYCINLAIFNDFSAGQKKTLLEHGAQILIYDCTFNGSSSDLYLEGFRVLIAPFSICHIENQFADILGMAGRTVAKNTNHISVSAQVNKLRLLVAEDDATNRLVIRAILKRLNIEHDIVANGLLILERYQQNPEAYDILLMDCEMPEMNGYQAAKSIREFEKMQGLKAIPIIALTAHVLPEYEQRCYENGMNMVVAKPVDIEELTNAFYRFIQTPVIHTDE